MFNALEPDHILFAWVDAAMYGAIFLALAATLRATIRRIARDESDARWLKTSLTTGIVLLLAGLALLWSPAQAFGSLLLVPVYLAGILLIRWLHWTPLGRAALVMTVFGIAIAALTFALHRITDQFLPKDRVTLVDRIRVSWGIVSGFTTGPAGGDAASEAERALHGESLRGAVLLLRDPVAADGAVAEHKDALAEVGMSDAGTNDLGALLDRAIDLPAGSEGQRGAELLRTAPTLKVFTAEDVREVLLFMAAARKTGPAPTGEEAAMLVRRARIRLGGLGTNIVAEAKDREPAPAPAETNTPPTDAMAPPVANAPTTTVNITTSIAEQPEAEDPFEGLTEEDRAAWMNSKTALVVTAVLYYGDTAMVKVNDEMVKLGEIAVAKVGERYFTWRMVGARGDEVFWEPVVRRKR